MDFEQQEMQAMHGLYHEVSDEMLGPGQVIIFFSFSINF